MVDDVLHHGREFAPDVLLFEPFALAGPLVAGLRGIRAGAHMFGPPSPREVVELTKDAVSPIWRSFGRDVPGWAGMYQHLTIQICPPMLEMALVPTGETMRLRPVPLPVRPPAATARPVVYVTFGTLFNSNLGLFQTALDALADEPVDVVMTVGRDQNPGEWPGGATPPRPLTWNPAELAPFPANARVEGFILQAELLP